MSGRLGYLLKKFPRLSETFVLGEIIGQEVLGRDITVYSRRTADDEPRHPDLARLSAEIVAVPSSSVLDPFRRLIEQVAADGAVLDQLGGVLNALDSVDPTRRTKLVAEALWLVEDTRQRDIDHLHVHFATESAIVARLAHALGGPSYSITAHAKDIYRNTVDAGLLDHLIANSAFTVTVCDANVRFIAERVSPRAASKVRRLYNGIDRAVWETVERDPEPDRVVTVGRLVAKKGLDTLIDAMSTVTAARPSARLDIVGEGEERRALETRCIAAGLADRIRFLGPLPADRVRSVIASATVFALPCRIGEDGNRDALPTVLLEAQAAGVPLVSCPVSGVAEILDDGRAGQLVPENDPAALATALLRVLDEPTAFSAAAAHGREHGRREFDRGTQAATLGTWFEEAFALRDRKEGPSCVSRT